jgi:S-adenosylmethionine hydrolase
MRPVVFMSDFGLVDDFAGVCHGVILQRAPGAHVMHLTHGITPQGVLHGAMVLRNTLPYMPLAVHLAVVDPGVGTARRALAVDCADGRSFVGPDNGLLVPAIEASGGAVQAVSIEDPEFILSPLSATFHGRDVFAPAAAYLAIDGPISDLGPRVDHTTLVRLNIPQPVVHDGSVTSNVWNVDQYGNAALHLDAATLESVLEGARHVELTIRSERIYATVARTYGNVRPGEALLYIDPYGCVSIAVNQGDAAAMFRLEAGREVSIEPAAVSIDASGPVVAMSPRSR